MTPRLRSRTLRGRMVMVNAVLMVIVLAIVVTLSGTFLRSYLIDRIDDGIGLAAEFLRTHQDEILTEPPDALAERVRAPNEFVAEYTTRDPESPIHRLHGEGPTLLRDIDVASAPDEVFTVEREGVEYRVIIVELPEHDALVLIGEPLTSVDATVNRLILIEVIVGSLTMVIALTAGSAVVRRGLRPLDDVVETAEGIAAGDLERRVPESAVDDVSEVSRLTLSINRMLKHLRGALHARARSEGELRRFVSDASHELRTPLTSIRGYLQMISQGVIDVRERPDVITRSAGETERMAAIVEDLLVLARLDEHPEPRREVVELGAIVEDSIADARAAQPERHWTTDVTAQGLVLGDEHELHRAVSNLLANVRAHTPASSPAVARVRRAGDQVVVEVTDAGPGIPEENADFVFERFYRAGADAAPKGSGLGLSIVRAIMQGHGGGAEFDSSVEDGTRVRLRFPPAHGTGDTGAPGGDNRLTPDEFLSPYSHLPRHSPSSAPSGLSDDAAPATRGRPGMADLLYRLGGFAFRRRGLVLVTWLLVLVVLGGAALQFRGPISDGFSIPNTESEQATDLLEARFSMTGEAVTTVLRAPEGGDVLDDEVYADAVRDTAAELEDISGVDMVVSPHSVLEDARDQYDSEVASAEEQALEAAHEGLEALVPADTPNRDQVIADQLPEAEEQALQQVAEEVPEFDDDEVLDQLPQLTDDHGTVLLQVQLTTRSGEAAPETVEAIVDSGDAARDAGMDLEHSGQAITQTPPELGHSEIIGVVAALVVLLINFGTVIAAGLPIVMALMGVGVGMALLFAMSSLMPLDSTAPMLAVMLGIAVAIDYSLFVLSRHRKQLTDGMAPQESAAHAIGTAGSAVVFAGLTVMIALLGLSIVRIPFLTVMGVAAMVTVAIAVLVAITLLPAVLGFLGHRVTKGPLPVFGRRAAAALRATDTFSARWIRGVTKRPIVTIVGVLVVLTVALLPLGSMHLGLPSDETSTTDTTQRQAHEIISDEFGAGYSAQLAVVADLTALPDMPAAAEDVAEHLEEVDGTADVLPPQLNDINDTAIITVIPEAGPSDVATEDVLHDIRDLREEIDADTGARIYVAGATAASIDVSERLADALPVFATVVVGLALVLMMVVFRSILVPVKAALGFVLSAGAALGLTVVVFQWGYGSALFNVEPGPLLAFMPTLVIGILFGLAMDYEVFLVSRMREDFVHGTPPRAAIISGFTHGARVVTAAAAIMITVFASFIFGDIAMLKPIAFVLAVGVAFDAFLVRMTLGPAVMALFGRAGWWLPQWLDRLLPNVDIEGAQLARTRTAHTEPVAEAAPAPNRDAVDAGAR